MSKRPMQSESTRKSDALESSEPVWMARWNRINSGERCNSGLDSLINEIGIAEKNTTAETMSDRLRISSNEEFPDPVLEQSPRRVREIRPMLFDNLGCGMSAASRGGIQLPYLFPDTKNIFSTRGYYFGEGTSSRLELMTAHSSAKNSTFMDAFIGSSSRNLMPSFNLENIDNFRGKAAAFPLNSSGTVNQVLDDKMKGLAQEHSRGHGTSAESICEINAKRDSRSDTTRNTLARNRSILFDSPSTIGCQPTCSQDSSKKSLQFPGVTLLPSQIRVSERTDYENYALETTRICTTTVDSVEATPAGCHRFSQTTHGLFVRRANADISKENTIFRTGQLFETNHLHSLSPMLFQGSNRGLKLKQLSSCSNEEQSSRSNDESRKFQHLWPSKHTTKNGSSLETEALDIGKSSSAVGANSATSSKDQDHASSSSPDESKVKSSRQIAITWRKDGALVDLNEELPEDSLEADPADRWVKRLKLSSSIGSKASKLFKNSSHCKANRKIIHDSSSRTSSRNHSATGGGHQGTTPKKDEPSGSDPTSKESLFSHCWIKRFMRKDDLRRRSEEKTSLVACEPECSSIQQLHKKQFPSIAAMALVGRAMNCVPAYEVQNKGSLTVWNT